MVSETLEALPDHSESVSSESSRHLFQRQTPFFNGQLEPPATDCLGTRHRLVSRTSERCAAQWTDAARTLPALGRAFARASAETRSLV